MIHNGLMTGSIPSEVGFLISLRKWEMFLNGLTGSIPSEVGHLSRLGSLDLHSNELYGTIPTELASLTKISSLDLSNNSFTGPIPWQFGSILLLSSLMITLDLSHNKLTGGVPTELGMLPNLSSLFLGGNNISGSVEGIFCNPQNNHHSSPAMGRNLSNLVADCFQVNCTCCTLCCPAEKGEADSVVMMMSQLYCG